jgi:DNA polymerase-3 subunit alpha
MKGAVEKGVPADTAKEIFDLMEKFGGYGFNKSHSAAYALITYQTAYLKAHFPVAFMAALLTSEMHSSDGVIKFIAECRSHDIPVQPPNINESDKAFTVRGGEILFGLVAVKNVGEGAIDVIIAERANGPFTSLFDFCERVDLRKVNKRVLESLIKCGAFDCTGEPRSRLLAALEDALDYVQRVQREKADPQLGLFDMVASPSLVNLPPLPQIPEWEERERLANEKEALGFYITGHPLQRYEDVLGKFTNATAVSLKERQDGEAVRIGGTVSSVKTIRTKRGEPMAFVTVEDVQGAVEVIVFSSLFGDVEALLFEDNPVLVQGVLQKDDKSLKIKADAVIPMDQAEEAWTAKIHLRLDATRTAKPVLQELQKILRRHQGNCQALLHLTCPEKSETIIALPEHLRVKAGAALFKEVNALLGYNAVETVCSAILTAPDPKNGYGGAYGRGQARAKGH